MNAIVASDLQFPALDADKAALLTRLVEGLKPAELYWIAAWSASLASQVQHDEPLAKPVMTKVAAERLTILYGSQTGNAKRIAEQLARRGEANGLSVRLQRADSYPQRELALERYLVVVISTQGDGEPPDDARGLVEFIASRRAPKLAALQFAVLGLGDSSYPQFCVIGRQLDARLIELGARRFVPAGEADVDVEAVATPWSHKVLEQASQLLKTTATAARITSLHAVPARSIYSREQPFAATVLMNQRIVARNSERDIRHIELSLEGSGLQYAPGDALGVWPRNPAVLVDQWLVALQLDGALDVTVDDRTRSLRQWLTCEREITRQSRSFIAALATVNGSDELLRVLRPEQAADFAALTGSCQPIDLLLRYPALWDAETLVTALRPLAPRLYSISSSPKMVGEEVHLTVAVVDYKAHGSMRLGAATAFLAASDEDDKIPVFIESNERFHLPADGSRDIIMIGPGTGVAPFRAFVQERQEIGATGRNWLFFGNRHFSRDFLYQVEWQDALKRGALARLDLAFSRDQADKTYVQHRLRERGAELYAWLQNGAHIYVCGDSTHMAKDVHATLIDVVASHGKQSPDAAKAWLNELLQQGRYARDVY